MARADLRFLDKPRYYDAPDGEKPVEKIVSTCKKGFFTGLLVGLHDCIMLTTTRNALQSLNCMAYWIVPLVGMSATFASVTYMSTRMRRKDDETNYAMGALACAPILHAWKKSTPTTMYGTLALVIFAMAAKHKNLNGWEVFPTPKHNYSIYEFDFSLTKPQDKNFRSPYL